MTRGATAALASLLLAACASPGTHLELGPTPPGVSVEARVQYYDVSAASLGELRAAMARLGPRWEGRAYQAVTQSHFRWTFQVQKTNTRCTLRRARVHLETVVIFPRWNPTSEPDSILVEWWRQLNTGLVEHERGHALLSVKAAGDIVKQLDKVESADCAAIFSQAQAAAENLVQASQRQQLDYDATTRHGAIQIQQAGRLRDP